MTNSTKLIGLIMTAALVAVIAKYAMSGAAHAVAQEMSAAGSGDDIPPDLQLPIPSGANMQAPAMQQSDGAGAPQAAEGMYGNDQGDTYDVYRQNTQGLWMQLAPIESTGTWLRRGFWYAEADAIVFNRMWDRADLRVAAQDVNVTRTPTVDPNTGNGTSLGFNPLFLDTNRVLIINGALPGEDATVRATLGNFLFRDAHNRDHTIEFTAIGGGNWDQQRELSSAAPFGLFVPFRISGGNRTFNQSSRQTIDYASSLDSFEMNYHVRSRLGHDQLVMDANGDWHRSANSGFEREYLVGLRFLELAEKLNWQAQDIVAVGNDGSYLIHTTNDLFGFQLGTGLTWQAPRWSVGVTTKGGAFVNSALGNTALNFTADDTNDAILRLRENQLSFVGELKIQGKYHILPNVSVRAGYELLYITSTALAPSQATFINDFAFLNTTGDPFYHGASFGLEYFW